MSKIDELIQEYCPDGVEYKKLDAVTTYERPDKYSVKSTAYDDAYETPVLTAGKTFILGYTNETDDIYQASKQSPVIIFDDFLAVCKWVDFPFKVKSSAMKFIHAATGINVRYLFYAMECIDYVPVDHARQWIATYSQFEIPVPPLPVQQEIVRILDSFTALQDELQKELEERKKQFAAVRNHLILDGGFNKVSLDEIATDFNRGSGIKRDEVTEEGMACVRYGEIYTEYGPKYTFGECKSHTNIQIKSPKYIKPGDILFAITGESVEDIGMSCAYIGNHECLCGGDIAVMSHNQDPAYIAYALSTPDAIAQKGFGKVKAKVVHTNIPSLKKISIPLPEINKQKEIAYILDNILDVMNQIEIEKRLRQQQYTYYRNKLLSFPHKEA